MNPVVHFEMPAENRDRICNFYSNVFGWQMQKLGPDMGNYIIVITTEMDGSRPKNPGSINGGFFEKNSDSGQHPSVVIAVENIAESMEKIRKAGGKILGEPVEIPQTGMYVPFIDSEGNRLSILQPSPM